MVPGHSMCRYYIINSNLVPPCPIFDMRIYMFEQVVTSARGGGGRNMDVWSVPSFVNLGFGPYESEDPWMMTHWNLKVLIHAR